jgi:ribonuclease III, bacterial
MQHVKNITTLMNQFNLDRLSRDTLQQAFYHSSYINELKGDQFSNERLEFLGDGVLNLIIAEFLYKTFTQVPEGELTKKRAQLVCEEALVVYANAIDLPAYLYLGKGEEKTGGRERAAIVADAFEAFIGAIFLTHGFDKAKEVLLAIFTPVYENGDIEALNVKDYKSTFQELVQVDPDKQIFYEVISEVGPPHNRTYTVNVLVDDIVYGIGEGKSKKEAEQKAAFEAISKLVK